MSVAKGEILVGDSAMNKTVNSSDDSAAANTASSSIPNAQRQPVNDSVMKTDANYACGSAASNTTASSASKAQASSDDFIYENTSGDGSSSVPVGNLAASSAVSTAAPNAQRQEQQAVKRSSSDFIFHDVVGEGSFSMNALTSQSVEQPISDSVMKTAVNSAGDSAAASTTSSSTSNTQRQTQQVLKKTPNDFKFGIAIGKGSFSIVYLAKDVSTSREYAIKVCEKRHILREKKQKAVMREKQIMNILNNHPSPFFIKLYCTFQDAGRLFFVMSYAKHGELLPYINKVGSFDEECTRFYAAEIVLALEHLHKLGIIHRDLKPENILLDENMHILITDFGSAKVLNLESTGASSSEQNKRNSFVGTAQYVSPEMLTDKNASTSSDLWALGCIIYQMVSGLPPFRAPNEYLIFQKITKLEYEFPDGFLPLAKDLVQKLLILEPSQRLGASDTNGYPSIKEHAFLCDVPWENLHECTPPRILPYLPGTSSNEELRSQYQVPDHVQPGLDDKQMTRLLGLALHEDEEEVIAKPARKSSILDIPPEEMSRRLAIQGQNNPFHKFVQGNLILKQGLVDKRKGLFARRRMLLLTTGPRLFYVDPASLTLKGEIPWSPELRPESKNFKIFFVHTPNRTYYLEDPEGYALEWCRVIDEVRKATYNQNS